MKDFKTFINEEHDDKIDPLHIQVDEKTLENNLDALNADLDRLTAAPYKNPIVFYDQIRGTLQRYGMIVPPHATKHFLNFDAEMVFKLGDSPYFLYVVFNTQKNALVDGYAQAVDMEELDHLIDSDEAPNLDDDQEEDEVEMEDDEMDEMGNNEKYRKRDSDAGDTSEY